MAICQRCFGDKRRSEMLDERVCKECGHRTKRSQVFTKKKSRINHRKEVRAYIRRLKSRSECKKCHTKHDLTFHHRDPKDKLFCIGSEAGDRTLIEVINEIAKCDIYCSDCHAELHRGDEVRYG